VLQILVVMKHRSMSQKLWHVLPDGFQRLAWADDEKIDNIVRGVIRAYVYGTTELAEQQFN
jgi:hypothetical protein